MPAIELLNDGRDGVRVLARMHYPNDNAACAWYFESFMTGSSGSQGKAPRGNPVLTVAELNARGSSAGRVLLDLACMACTAVEEPSIRKVAIVQEARARQQERDEAQQETDLKDLHPEWAAHAYVIDETKKRKQATSRRAFTYRWREFRAVSHLWAAHRLLEEFGGIPFYAIPELLENGGQWRQFLGWAQWFLAFGQALQSRNDFFGPLFNVARMWVVTPTVDPIMPDLPDLADEFESLFAKPPMTSPV
jgi:hypothetical protein